MILHNILITFSSNIFDKKVFIINIIINKSLHHEQNDGYKS